MFICNHQMHFSLYSDSDESNLGVFEFTILGKNFNTFVIYCNYNFLLITTSWNTPQEIKSQQNQTPFLALTYTQGANIQSLLTNL